MNPLIAVAMAIVLHSHPNTVLSYTSVRTETTQELEFHL